MKETWQDRFDKEFVQMLYDGPELIVGDVYQPDRIKQFISQLLKEQNAKCNKNCEKVVEKALQEQRDEAVLKKLRKGE